VYVVNKDLLDRLGVPRRALRGKTALVTGGARGIGEGVAMTLAVLGAQVVVVDRLERGQAVADAIRQAGGEAAFVRCDLAIVDEVQAMLRDATAAFGKVDIYANCAVHFEAAPVVALELANWETTFATNARAPFLALKHLLPGMLERRDGVIVNVIAYEGSALGAAYSGTKMAMRSLAYSAAREIGDESGVSVFSFVPGIVDTPLIRDVIVPQVTALTGMTAEQALQLLAQNPGYPGLMPVDHCVTGLAYAIVHGAEYHGQVADPFEPLNRIGVIRMPYLDPAEPSSHLDISDPQSLLYVKQYLSDVTSLNRQLEQRVAIRTRELEDARRRSESLLLNILPRPIADRLQQGESMIADYFAEVTVLFADLVGFTPLSARLAPGQVVALLDAVFSTLDAIADRHELEKIKTIGDCYMMVGGLPEPRPDHAEAVADAALEMLPELSRLGRELDLPLSVRIGVHSGDVVAGVIGRQKFIYDLWGDTVNTASRMESQGVGGQIQCTENVYRRLGDRYRFEPRGVVDVKGKGPMPTYLLVGGDRIPEPSASR
jgi:class 3 adenylate cyclase/NAD(P)-dependent dehydrogenase (short-subunit alcohol dehydrogenase family)